jgi:NADH-quinone oxidoreductase subunit M
MGTLLVSMLLVPVVGIAVLYALPRDSAERYATRIGFLAGAIVMLLAAILAATFTYGTSKPQGVVDGSWVSAFKLRFHLAVDGISLPLVLLTALLTALCFFYSIRHLPNGDDGEGDGAVKRSAR